MIYYIEKYCDESLHMMEYNPYFFFNFISANNHCCIYPTGVDIVLHYSYGSYLQNIAIAFYKSVLGKYSKCGCVCHRVT